MVVLPRLGSGNNTPERSLLHGSFRRRDSMNAKGLRVAEAFALHRSLSEASERSGGAGRLGGLGGGRIDADLEARLALVLELHHAVDQRVDSVVRAETHVVPRVPLGAALAENDVAGDDLFAAVL